MKSLGTRLWNSLKRSSKETQLSDLSFRNLKDLVLAGRTCHKFERGHVLSKDFLNECLELSLLAPNHKLTFPWRVYEVEGEYRHKLADLSASMMKEKGGDGESIEKARDKVLDPSCLLVYTLPLKPENAFEEREDYATISCSIQLLALALQSEGWHYKWSTGGLTRHAKTYELLEIFPDKEEIVGFIWIGRAKVLPKLKERPPVGEVLRQLS